jgi:hypothetical protein
MAVNAAVHRVLAERLALMGEADRPIAKTYRPAGQLGIAWRYAA